MSCNDSSYYMYNDIELKKQIFSTNIENSKWKISIDNVYTENIIIFEDTTYYFDKKDKKKFLFERTDKELFYLKLFDTNIGDIYTGDIKYDDLLFGEINTIFFIGFPNKTTHVKLYRFI